MTGKHRVLIGVATCRRPKMLERCLESLGRQIIDGCNVHIVVASNGNGEDVTHAAVERFAASSLYPVELLHDPVQGIARARNAILAAATRHRADWIAFVDDDEIADPDWLACLMAPQYLGIPVLMGAQHYVYPDPVPFWATAVQRSGIEGERLRTAYTNNVRFSADLIRAGLRFDEAIGLGQGSDSDFFARARVAGFEIRRTLRAITRETVHPERLTYRAQLYRSLCVANAKTKRQMAVRGLSSISSPASYG
jgi:succinoglycan biosynthesis protein ExoM